MRITFAHLLAEARKNSGITQDDLAKMLSVSRPMISHWENGRVVPDIDTIRRLSEILKYDFFAEQARLEEERRLREAMRQAEEGEMQPEEFAEAEQPQPEEEPEELPEIPEEAEVPVVSADTAPAEELPAQPTPAAWRFSLRGLLMILSAVTLSLVIILLLIMIFHELSGTPLLQVQMLAPIA